MHVEQNGAVTTACSNALIPCMVHACILQVIADATDEYSNFSREQEQGFPDDVPRRANSSPIRLSHTKAR